MFYISMLLLEDCLVLQINSAYLSFALSLQIKIKTKMINDYSNNIVGFNFNT